MPGRSCCVKETDMMRLRFSVLTGIFLATLSASPVCAEPTPSRDHLSYYTYYKTVSGETVGGVASKFGIAESSLIRMNPYLNQYQGTLPDGLLVCVPKESSQEAHPGTSLLARSERRTAAAASAKEEQKKAAEAAKLSKKSGTSKSASKAEAEKKVDSEWPDEAEWEKLADLATKGAPPPPVHASMVIEAPPSRFIRGNGEVVFIPAAKPKPSPVKKVAIDTSRGELSSRKGKAIYQVITSCRSYMGVPYVWGGEDPSGFDCSGYIQYVYGKHGISLPRTADIQFNVGKVVKRGAEKPGDLVFFETYCPGPSHVGVYLGRDYFIHASSSRGVTVDRLSSDFFGQRYLGAKRNF